MIFVVGKERQYDAACERAKGSCLQDKGWYCFVFKKSFWFKWNEN